MEGEITKKEFVKIMAEFGHNESVAEQAWEVRPVDLCEERCRQLAKALRDLLDFSDILEIIGG